MTASQRWLLTSLLLAIVAYGAGACGEKDGNGGGTKDSGGTDCTASDDTTCDGLDDDCDGSTDEDATWQDWYSDADGDGYGNGDAHAACAQPLQTATRDGDCDDSDAGVYPGADEVCDAIDNDCDALVDDADGSLTGADSWYLDQDGDGYGYGPLFTFCDQPSGFTSTDGDCDDFDAAVSPDGTETCDGFDNDCDGLVDGDDPDGTGLATWYQDADGDGFGTPSTSVQACDAPAHYADNDNDCDDARSSVNPDADEECNDDKDNDCDGTANGCHPIEGTTVRSSATDAVITGTASTNTFGNWISGGDLTGDGKPDVVIPDTYTYSGYGAVLAWSSVSDGDSLTWSDAAAGVYGSSGSYLGRGARIVPDLTGDGYEDLVVADQNLTSWLVAGPVTGLLPVVDAAANWTGLEGGDNASTPFASADVTGDGVADLIVGDPIHTTSYNYDGRTWVVAGPVTTSTTAQDLDIAAAATIDGSSTSEYFGWVVTPVDADGDGNDDLLASSPYDSSYGYTSGGSVTIWENGSLRGSLTKDDAKWTLIGTSNSAFFGWDASGAGDYDDDGYDDLVITAPYWSSSYGSGAAFVFSGPLTATTLYPSHAQATLYGDERYFGYSASPVGDLDADGNDDLGVGELGYPYSTTPNAGALHLFYGPLSGTTVSTAADATVADSSGTSGYYFGFRVRPLGDLDSDGYDDFATGGLGASTVDVFFGGSGL